MANASKTRLQGDQYQFLWSWHEALRLLAEKTPVVAVTIEADNAGAADDIVVEELINTTATRRCIQVKWHVDHRTNVSFDYFTLVAKGAKRSILGKLFDAWKKLCALGPVEIVLRTNHGPDATLGEQIDGNHCLKQCFVDGTVRGQIKTARTGWKTHLAASDTQFVSFLNSLRLEVAGLSMEQLEAEVARRMESVGLKRDANSVILGRERMTALARGLATGRRLDVSVLRAIVNQADLWAEGEARLWLHAWARHAFAKHPTEELDWTALHDRAQRRVPPPAVWQAQLLPELKAMADRLHKKGRRRVEVSGLMPLTTNLTVGYMLPFVGRFQLATEQPTSGGLARWTSDTAPSSATLREDVVDGDTNADALVVTISITGNARPDVEAHLKAAGLGHRAALWLSPTAGWGDTALGSAADAVALATHARRILRDARGRWAARTIHLFLYCPAGFALFLGQQLSSLGTIHTYERTLGNGYQASVVLETG